MIKFYFLQFLLIPSISWCQSHIGINTNRVDKECLIRYDRIYHLAEMAYDILYDTTKSISKRIELSKNYAKEGLNAGTHAISKGFCNEYTVIVDRMIGLAILLEKTEQARMLALERLDVVYPGWKEYDTKIERTTNKFISQDLYVLADLQTENEGNTFYDDVRKYGQPTTVCGNVFINEPEIAQKLSNQHGDIYAFRYIQSLHLNINIMDESTNETNYYQKLYDLFIDLWSQYISISRILELYENAPIQTHETSFSKSTYAKYFIEVDGTRFYFKPTVKDKMKLYELKNLVQPDPEIVKKECLFYKRLLVKAGK